jgi:hypothetical protein
MVEPADGLQLVPSRCAKSLAHGVPSRVAIM